MVIERTGLRVEPNIFFAIPIVLFLGEVVPRDKLKVIEWIGKRKWRLATMSHYHVCR
jgi:hypothetical protein